MAYLFDQPKSRVRSSTHSRSTHLEWMLFIWDCVRDWNIPDTPAVVLRRGNELEWEKEMCKTSLR